MASGSSPHPLNPPLPHGEGDLENALQSLFPRSSGRGLGVRAIRMIREAISLHIEDLVAHGEPIPPVDSESIPDEQSLVLDV